MQSPLWAERVEGEGKGYVMDRIFHAFGGLALNDDVASTTNASVPIKVALMLISSSPSGSLQKL